MWWFLLACISSPEEGSKTSKNPSGVVSSSEESGCTDCTTDPSKGGAITDTFVVGNTRTDVLWVVDNSCSMAEEQDELATNFHAFLDSFLEIGMDFHIGVISTDMDNPSHSGILQNGGSELWIDRDTKDPYETFRSMTRLGTGGADMEQGRAATYAALDYRAKEENFGFIREEATLHVIVVSDEDDYSGADPIGLDPFIDFMLDYKADPDRVTFSSIVGPPGGCGGGIFNFVEPGRDYIPVTEEVGGILHSICSDDWSAILDELGLMVTDGVTLEFALSRQPIPTTLVVEVFTETGAEGPLKPGEDWAYNPTQNSLSFLEYVPPPLAEVFITYEESASY